MIWERDTSGSKRGRDPLGFGGEMSLEVLIVHRMLVVGWINLSVVLFSVHHNKIIIELIYRKYSEQIIEFSSIH